MTLTKAILLEKTKPSTPELLGEFFGLEIYIKPVSELVRSMRISSLYDRKKDEVREDSMQKARAMTIIDHLCDEDGKQLFSNKDVSAVMGMDVVKVDILIDAIEKWQDARVGKLTSK